MVAIYGGCDSEEAVGHDTGKFPRHLAHERCSQVIQQDSAEASSSGPGLAPWQSGFRPKRSTTEQIVALRLIIDRCRARRKDVVVVFVDFRKAFDSVDRHALKQIIQLYGVPDNLAGPAMALYNGTTATVRTPEGPTAPFTTTSGILQGDTLAPFLFVMVMDFVLRTALIPVIDDAFTISASGGHLPALAYADDVALLANSFEGADRMTKSLSTVAASVGLHLNMAKTEVLAFTGQPAPTPPLPSFPLIQSCSDFTYLGSQMAASKSDLDRRRRLAWTATRSLEPIYTSAVKDETKIRLFRAVVEPIFLYGCESWAFPKSTEDQIDASHRALLRAALNIHWPAAVTNDELYQRPGVKPAASILRYKRLVLFGKAVREGDWPLSKVLCQEPQEKHRGRGRPPTTMWSVLKEDFQAIGLTFPGAWDAATNARAWRRLIGDL